MLAPKRVKYRKQMKGRTKGHATRGNTVSFGQFALIIDKHRRVLVEADVTPITTGREEGGIVKFPAPIHSSNVMLLDPKSGDPTRIRRQKDKDGTVERLSVRSGQAISRTR